MQRVQQLSFRLLPAIILKSSCLRPRLQDNTFLRGMAQFETVSPPHGSADYWGYQVKQARVVVDGHAYAYVIRNFDDELDLGEVAQQYNGYTDVIVGAARINA